MSQITEFDEEYSDQSLKKKESTLNKVSKPACIKKLNHTKKAIET